MRKVSNQKVAPISTNRTPRSTVGDQTRWIKLEPPSPSNAEAGEKESLAPWKAAEPPPATSPGLRLSPNPQTWMSASRGRSRM